MSFQSIALPLLAVIAAAAFLIAIPIWITSLKPKERPDGQDVERILKDPYVRRTILRLEIGGILAGTVAVIFAVWGLYQANYQSRLAEQALKDQRISSAWQIIAQPGATGKGYALNILANDTNERLLGLSMRCGVEPTRISAFDNAEECAVPTLIQRIDIGSLDKEETQITKSDFSFAEISDVKFENVFLTLSNFSNARIWNAEFRSLDLVGLKLDHANVANTKFIDVSLHDISFRSASFGAVLVQKSTLVNVDFTDLTYGEVTLSDSKMYQVNFTNVDFSDNKIRFKNLRNFVKSPEGEKPLRMLDGGYFTDEQFNISGATFCTKYDGEDATCWKDATQEFFDRAWYFEADPPKGLEHLPFKAKLRIGCEAKTIFDNPEGHACLTGPLKQFSQQTN